MPRFHFTTKRRATSQDSDDWPINCPCPAFLFLFCNTKKHPLLDYFDVVVGLIAALLRDSPVLLLSDVRQTGSEEDCSAAPSSGPSKHALGNAAGATRGVV